MKRVLLFVLIIFSISFNSNVLAQRFGKVDNLYEYILKGQAEKFDKNRQGVKPKEIETFKNEVEYADKLKQTLYGTVEDSYEAYFNSYINVNLPPSNSNLGLICTGLKTTPDTFKVLADKKIIAVLQQSKNVQVDGRGVLAAIDKTGYPVTDSYRKVLTDLVFNAQYNELLTAPTLMRYRAFIVDWPNSDVLASVKKNYDDALFLESENTKKHDLYLMDDVLPNDTKKHLVPDDWSLYGDKFSDKKDYAQATVMYNKAIQLGSKEGLFKLTLLQHEGKINSDQDELVVFQKLADSGDKRAKDLVEKIQNRSIQLAVPGSLSGMLTAKDKVRILNMTISGSVDSKDLSVLREMATKGKLRSINLNESNLSVLEDAAFKGCVQLQNLKLPSSMRSIGNEAIADCPNLKDFILPDSLQEIMGSSLNNCTSLTSLKIPASLVRGLGFVTFCSGCSTLSQILVDEANPVYSSLDGILYNKDKSIIIRYPSGKQASLFSSPNTVVEIAAGAFESCSYLSTIMLNESLKSVRNFAFKGCSSLTAMTIPSLVAEVGSETFENCTKLTSINLPMFLTEISYAMFKNCSSLTQITIPESVREIRAEAFSGCSSLGSVELGASLKGLGDNSFKDCAGLKDIVVKIASPISIPAIFEGVNGTTCTLHVPFNSKQLYQQYPVWKNFQNIVEILSE